MTFFLRIGILLLALISAAAEADITIGSTRIIYPGNVKDATVTVENSGDAPFLIQSWVQSMSDSGEVSDAPFIVTPPLFRLNARQKNVLRIIRTGGELPDDRESLYWLDIKSIPSKDPKVQSNKLVLAVKSEFKLIFRPTSLTQLPEDLTEKLVWKQQGNTLTVNNPTPYYMNFAQVSVGSEKIKPIRYVAPFSNKSFMLPSGVSGRVTWSLINDFGGTGPQHEQQ